MSDPAIDLAQRNAEHEPEFHVQLTYRQAVDLASGYVWDSVKAQVRLMLDFAQEDERRAGRPVPERKTTKKKKKHAGPPEAHV